MAAQGLGVEGFSSARCPPVSPLSTVAPIADMEIGEGIFDAFGPCHPVALHSNVSKDFTRTRFQKLTMNMYKSKDVASYLQEELTRGDHSKTVFYECNHEPSTNLTGASMDACPGDLGAKKWKRTHQKDMGSQVKQRPQSSSTNESDNIEPNQNVEPSNLVTDGMLVKNCSKIPKEDHFSVRVRRGQITNSHSIAERLRRDRISERMKFLQDLVPGCSNVTGKTLVLDEIINYVQSLQQQVEFLSMKLAAVCSQNNYSTEGLRSSNLHSWDGTSSATGLAQQMVHPHTYASKGFDSIWDLYYDAQLVERRAEDYCENYKWY